MKNLLLKPIKKCKPFSKMSKCEKKNFLSNDFIERMIRVEQRVSGAFGEAVHYKKTKYYQSLTPGQRSGFEKYLKKSKNTHKIILISAFAALFIFAFLKIGFTGHAISNAVGSSAYNFFSILAIVLVIAGFFLFVFVYSYKKIKEKRFNNHFEVIDKIVRKRRLKGFKV